MDIVVFGASGPTGLKVTQMALHRGHAVTAVTRRPEAFGLEHALLRVVGADLTDVEAVDRAVGSSTGVVATFGTRYSRAPITLYSEGMANILRVMADRGVTRLVCVTSKEVVRERAPGEPLLYRAALDPLLRTLGRSLYADMRRMEAQVRASATDWTIVRPAGLFDGERTTTYRMTTGHQAGLFTSRADLADVLVRQVTGDEPLIRQAVEVLTEQDTPRFLSLIRREAFGR